MYLQKIDPVLSEIFVKEKMYQKYKYLRFNQ
jgi:hypothetical protein